MWDSGEDDPLYIIRDNAHIYNARSPVSRHSLLGWLANLPSPTAALVGNGRPERCSCRRSHVPYRSGPGPWDQVSLGAFAGCQSFRSMCRLLLHTSHIPTENAGPFRISGRRGVGEATFRNSPPVTSDLAGAATNIPTACSDHQRNLSRASARAVLGVIELVGPVGPSSLRG